MGQRQLRFTSMCIRNMENYDFPIKSLNLGRPFLFIKPILFEFRQCLTYSESFSLWWPLAQGCKATGDGGKVERRVAEEPRASAPDRPDVCHSLVV